MSSSIIQFVASLVTPLLVAVVTAVLTVQLSLRRFQAERWWDRKADAYSRIVEALYHVIAHASMSYKEYFEDARFHEDYKKERVESYQKAVRDLEIATGVGAYVISDEAAKILTEVAKRPRIRGSDEAIAAEFDDYTNALTKVRELAKKDLKVH
jgi:hypothetical protein